VAAPPSPGYAGDSGGGQQVAFPAGSSTLDFGTPGPSKVNAVTLRAGYEVCLFSQALSCSGSGAGGVRMAGRR